MSQLDNNWLDQYISKLDDEIHVDIIALRDKLAVRKGLEELRKEHRAHE